MSDDVTTTDPADELVPSLDPVVRDAEAAADASAPAPDAERERDEAPEPEPEPERPVATSDHWRVAFVPDSSQRLVYVGPDTAELDGPDWRATHGPDTLPAGSRIADPTPAP